MGITERREREKTERRKAILNSTRELILSQGVERVSMEDIARKAELSKATLYLYFTGKEVIFNEICEEAARDFLELFKPLLETGLTGIAALRCFWQGYIELFGNSDDMIIIFQVRNYLNSWQPIISRDEQGISSYVDAIIKAIETIIDQCKAEGVFDPDLDSLQATRMLLSMFSVIMENASRISPEARKSPAVINEMANVFQIIIRGFAKEGIDRSLINISGL